VSDGTASFRFIHLLAGVGGFHAAFRDLDGQGVFVAEWDPALNALYRENFELDAWTGVNSLDAPAVISREVPDHDVLTAENDLHAYKALGNAVNARVIRAIAEPPLKDLRWPDQARRAKSLGETKAA
jgi:site-specific DNA-cytosine methylase